MKTPSNRDSDARWIGIALAAAFFQLLYLVDADWPKNIRSPFWQSIKTLRER